MLARKGIEVFTRIAELGGVSDVNIDTANPDRVKLRALQAKELPVLDDGKGQEMIALVEDARSQGDSLGGVAQCFVLGLPAGLGDPIFAGVESRLASLLYGIPAVKGVSFGDGFAVCARKGSENNDPFYLDQENRVRTLTNHEGGINGGITNGMPLVFQVGIKPTPSIARPQSSINLETLCEETLLIQGRHDPAIVPRAAVAVEAAAAIAITDLLLVAYGIQDWGGRSCGRA
jgi:chorismate synthase